VPGGDQNLAERVRASREENRVGTVIPGDLVPCSDRVVVEYEAPLRPDTLLLESLGLGL
jgi:hypothetical protein